MEMLRISSFYLNYKELKPWFHDGTLKHKGCFYLNYKELKREKKKGEIKMDTCFYLNYKELKHDRNTKKPFICETFLS